MPEKPTSSLAKRLERIEVLYKISSIISTTLDSDKVLKAVLKEVVRITSATSGSISMLDSKRGILEIATAIGIPEKKWKQLKLQLGIGVTGWVAYKCEPLLVADVRRDPHYVSVKTDVRSELAVPMMLRGRLIGVINVDSTRVAAFTGEDEKLLMAVAEQSARVIETARLHGKLRRHAERMEALFALGNQLIARTPVENVLRLVIEQGRDLLGADVCMLLKASPDTTTVQVRGLSCAKRTEPWNQASVQHNGLLQPVIHDRETVAVEDLRALGRTFLANLRGSARYRAMLAVPVAFGDQVQAVIVALDENTRSYSETDQRMLQLLANQCGLAIENAWRQELIASMEDSLHKSEKFSVLGTLAAEIAHEIRNPVTIINLLLDSISEDMGEESQTAEDLRIVREKLDRIERIIDQTLNMARDKDPEKQVIGINGLVGDIRLFMDYKLAKAGIQVRSALGGSLPAVAGDRGQLQQVLLNLILNAMEAMEGGGRLALSTDAIDDPELGHCVAVIIRDNGKGIRKDDLESILEPFFTTRREGTGLGLFISNKIIRAHGGAIRVKSRVGRGSTFTVLLPALESGDIPRGSSAEDLLGGTA